ncbi:MAG TPA: MerR family transcriptional regulator [Micromonosporaceae bacterium]|jgi:DNA-binding transcriptional MerR regulator
MLRIGEFARLTRVSVRMLRHYHRLGLLVPARVDLASGYRYYRAAQLRTLNRILHLRDLGFGMAEIARALDVDEAAYLRREKELLAQLAATTRQLTAVQARRTLRDDADVVIRRVPAVRVATLGAEPGTDVEPLFDALETHVGTHRARADRPPLMVFDAGSITVAVPVSRPVPESALPNGYGVMVRTLPAATMACTVHNGPYAELAGRLERMRDWLAATGREPVGPLREVYLRFGADPRLRLPPSYVADDTDPAYVTELQLPLNSA